jgi:DNA-binding NarL/FixJ family response regulator
MHLSEEEGAELPCKATVERRDGSTVSVEVTNDLISELHDVNPRARALVLSATLDPAEIARAIESGAAATLDKTAELDELVDRVRRLHKGAALPS